MDHLVKKNKPRQHDRIVELLSQGVSEQDVARELSVTLQSVYKVKVSQPFDVGTKEEQTKRKVEAILGMSLDRAMQQLDSGEVQPRTLIVFIKEALAAHLHLSGRPSKVTEDRSVVSVADVAKLIDAAEERVSNKMAIPATKVVDADNLTSLKDIPGAVKT